METPNDVLVGLDVGTHKVLCVIARPAAEPGRYDILGFGLEPSEGMKNGIVHDVEKVVKSVRKAVATAQYGAQVTMEKAWVAIGGETLTSENCVGTAVVRGNEVKQPDVDTAEANARENSRRVGRQLIKMQSQGYRCGDTFTAESPIGLTGDRVEAVYHAVYGSVSNAENIKRCLLRSGLELAGYEPHPWAAASAVLNDTDRYCGTAVFDIGEETTSITVFYENRILFTDVRPYGAEFFTRDVAMMFGITLEQAEELKVTVGHCLPDDVLPGETVQPTATGGRPSALYSRHLLARTLRERAEEFFGLYKKLLDDNDLTERVHNVVITGGGANLKGIDTVARNAFGTPVRIGRPIWTDGRSQIASLPEASVAIGLIVDAGRKRGAMDARGYRTRPLPALFARLKTIVIGDY